MRASATPLLVLHGVANDGEGLFAAAAVRNEVVGAIEISPVDLVDGHEFFDVERVGALDLDRLDLFGADFDVLALGDLCRAPNYAERT